MLKINDTRAGYEKVNVLWDITLEVGKGELVALIGSNGAGKSTLLRVISGIIRVSAGALVYDGIEITRLPPHEIADMGLIQVPEGRELFSRMTVYDNLLIGAQTARSWENHKQQLEKVFDLFPALASRKKQIAGSLSGGEQQMLALGRALMGVPELLMLDEPSLGLAPIVVTDLFRTIRDLNKEGLTIFLVEQNVRLALKICKRGYVLERGRIKKSAESGTLLRDETIQDAYLGV